jgi:hypothetical protein
VLGLILPETLRDDPPAAPSPFRRAVDRTTNSVIRLQLAVFGVGIAVLVVCLVARLVQWVLTGG